MSAEELERCHYCGTADIGKRNKRGDDRDTELRPYGPGGSFVCWTCAMGTPERQEAARLAFGALLSANEAISSGPVAIGTQEGPHPFAGPAADQ